MYYFVPKQAGRPIYSYRLSIVHFWALISIYMWAGPHHLHYTSLPDWVQSLGMVFSVILLAPSWGGMINGIMTLSGAWYKLRTDPILKFLIVSLSFYGMSTFEGPMMSIKTVNALSHNTDWTIGHVHSGALGWVAFMAIGSMYCADPEAFGRKEMCSVRLIDVHFWISTIGVVLYVTAMWIAGVMQGLMWRATNPDGTLTYTFVEIAEGHLSVLRGAPAAAACCSSCGMFIMLYNVIEDRDAPRRPHRCRSPCRRRSEFGRRSQNESRDRREERGLAAGHADRRRHQRRRPGGDRAAVFQASVISSVAGHQALRAPLELAGRDVYVREGCYLCHTQMVRPLAGRNRALRTLFDRRRGRVRPSVPIRLQAHRTRSGARRRKIFGSMASHPPEQSARRGARIEHAGLHLAGEGHDRRRSSWPRRCACCAALGMPYTRRGDRRGAARGRRGHNELDALIAYLQGLKFHGDVSTMIGIVRGVITLVLMVLFIALIVWAWSGRRKNLFDAMARMPLEEDAAPPAARPGSTRP